MIHIPARRVSNRPCQSEWINVHPMAFATGPENHVVKRRFIAML
jgi:hypothetical protein